MQEYRVRYEQVQTIVVTVYAETAIEAAEMVERDEIPADSIMDGATVVDWQSPIVLTVE